MNSVIDRLKSKYIQIEEKTHQYDDRSRMSRTLLFGCLKSQVRSYRQMEAINLAIELQTTDFRKIDIAHYVTMVVPETIPEKDDLFQKAQSIYLNERKRVVRYLISSFLPICKKEILRMLE